MQTAIDGALRRTIARPLVDQLLATGFTHLTEPQPLAGKFVIVHLADVTEGGWGYDWQLSGAVVVATNAFGPWRFVPSAFDCEPHAEGVTALAYTTMPVVSYESVSGQVSGLYERVLAQYRETTIPPPLRAWNQVARAEWHWHKAEGARQGVWDRLYREGLLDDMDREDRNRLVEWAVQFGADPMMLRRERAAHERATWSISRDRIMRGTS